MSQQKIIIIVGPTSSGKSTLAVKLARKFGGEVISADSRQVYKGLDIGTGKITKHEMRAIRHHLLDVVSPKKTFTAHDFVVHARRAIEDIAARGKLPIICGGTGFYIDAFVGRIVLPNAPANPRLRERLKIKTSAQLFSLLQRRDPRRAKTIDRHNKRRLIRALEIAKALGRIPYKRGLRNPFLGLWIGTTLPEAVLRARINRRLKERFQRGMVAEARRLHRSGLSYKRMHELGLEYRSLARSLQGKISRSELELELQSAIWRYAKRQMTYWKRNKEIHWFKPNDKKISKLVRRIVHG